MAGVLTRIKSSGGDVDAYIADDWSLGMRDLTTVIEDETITETWQDGSYCVTDFSDPDNVVQKWYSSAGVLYATETVVFDGDTITETLTKE